MYKCMELLNISTKELKKSKIKNVMNMKEGKKQFVYTRWFFQNYNYYS